MTVQNFFTQYQEVCTEHNIDLPLYIWNCDESGVQDIPKEDEVIGVKEKKANRQGPSKRGETSTILTFANAYGQVMPPLVINKGCHVNDTWEYGCPPDIMLHASTKGYINKGIFYEYALRWVGWLRCNKRLEKTNLVLLDAHKSHIYNLCFIHLMVRNKIEVLAIPAHTSHVLQLLDSTPFANFKMAWNSVLIKYLFTSVGAKCPNKISGS